MDALRPRAAPSRRRVLTAAVALAVGAAVAPRRGLAGVAIAVAEPGVRFELLRDGSRIGTHATDIFADGDRVDVETHIDVRVRRLGLTLFAYRHRASERYSGGRLVAFDSETDDDGSRFFVNGRAQADGFAVRTRKGDALLPADVLVGSYWHPMVLRRPALLDPQRGRLRDQVIEGSERVRLAVAGGEVEATRYRVSGIVTGSVVYDDAGRWLAATVVKKGADIVYRRLG